MSKDKNSSIYPDAKSYDELQRDEQIRSYLRNKKRERLPNFKMSLYGGLLVTVMVYFFSGVQGMWLSGNISSIFFSFSLGISILLLNYAFYKYVEKVFYYSDKSAAKFFSLYAIMGIVFALLFHSLTSVNLERVYFSLLVGLLSFVSGYVLSRMIFKIR